MNLITRSYWINRSAEEERTPTFTDAGILLLGALLCAPGRIWARLRYRRPTAGGGAWNPTVLDVRRPPLFGKVATPFREMLPRTPAPGTAIRFTTREGAEQ